MLRYFLLSLSFFAAISGHVFAEHANLQPEVIVTATRVAQTLDSTLADVSVINRDEIEASAARDISDLLRLQAGVDIARTGGPGGQTSVFIRGTNNNSVLVLIDGVRVSSLNTGAFTWETLPLADIERIEIVRGPRASYWGSDAIGGVVQIFTRDLKGPRIALGYGSYGDVNANAGIGQRSERGGYSVQVGARDYEGFPSQNEDGFSYENKNHGLENQNLAARGDLRMGEQVLGGAYVRSEGTTEFSGGDSDFTEQVFSATLGGQLNPIWQHQLSVGSAREDYKTPVYYSEYQSRRDSAGWKNEISIASQQSIVIGIDYMHEQGENLDTFSGVPVYRETRSDTGLYAGWNASAGAFSSELAARIDDNSVWGNQTTGSIAAGWQFNPDLRAYASYGQGFRGPTLNEQYSPGFGGAFAGNPDLEPETSQSTELGFEWIADAGQRLKANLYSTNIRNLISFTGVDFRAENVARVSIDGVELSYEKLIGNWQWTGNYTWQDPRNEESDTQLLRRPMQKIAGTLERNFGESTAVGAEVIYASDRSDFGGIELPAYVLLNLRATWLFAPTWKLVARVENLTNRDYELAHGYNTPGRSGFVELVWAH